MGYASRYSVILRNCVAVGSTIMPSGATHHVWCIRRAIEPIGGGA